MATPTADQAAQAWAQNLGGATQRIQQGVQAVTVSPGQLAARQKQLWQQKVMESMDKWAANVGAVSLGDWQNAMVTKGVPRIASGATAAQPKFAAFMGELLPYIERQRQSLPARGDLETNINRMTTFVRGMSQFKRGQK